MKERVGDEKVIIISVAVRGINAHITWLSVTHSYTAANSGAEYCGEPVCLSVRGCVFVSP